MRFVVAVAVVVVVLVVDVVAADIRSKIIFSESSERKKSSIAI